MELASNKGSLMPATTHRLSALQRRIITEIANHTVNSCECPEYWSHGWKETFMPWAALLGACYSFWDDETGEVRLMAYRPKILVAKASLSRAVKSLLQRDFVCGLALQWRLVHARGIDELCWQGGGRGRKDAECGCRFDVPRLKMVGLSHEKGWPAARELLGNDVGRCEHVGVTT
jgi:hypothetical protein